MGPFLLIVQKWNKNLALISNILTTWSQVQLKWMYLEGIFLEEKFRLQLPEEALKFDDLNGMFNAIVENVKENRKILYLCDITDLLDDLNKLFDGFETCQKSLSKYLDSKRKSFPRFFFLSDNELLSILGNTNPDGIQEHIVKMFDNIGSLLFINDSRENTLVSAMVSCEKETMQFRSKVMARGSVENWMNDVLIEMWRSNRYLIKKSIYDYGSVERSRCEWMLDHQGMMCLAANGVWWTAEVENAFMEIQNVHINIIYIKYISYWCIDYICFI